MQVGGLYRGWRVARERQPDPQLEQWPPPPPQRDQLQLSGAGGRHVAGSQAQGHALCRHDR